jgi:hypothetical protein
MRGLRREPHDYRSSLQVFDDLNIARVASELELERKGAERGSRNEPDPGSSGRDDVELAIIERIQAEKKGAHGLLLEEFRVYRDRLSVLDFEGRFSLIEQAAPEAVGSIRAEAAQGRDDLHRLRRELVELERERDAFRDKHGLSRTARPLSGATKALKIGILAVIIVVEVFINGSFLAKSNELGLLGGTVEAFSFACLNVLISFFLGLIGARQINHRNYWRKAIVLFSITTYILIIGLLNLALAHYREISGTITADAGQQVMEHIIAAPFVLSDLKSWLFFMVGAIFSAISFGDGVLFTDPYPGYGLIEQRLKAAHETYAARKSTLIDGLEDIRDEVSETLREARRDLTVRRSEHDAILESRARMVSLFEEHQDQLEHAATALLSTYYEANRGTRTTSVPRRFSQKFKLSRYKVGLEQFPESARDDLRRQIAENQALLVRQVEMIQQEFETAVSAYHQIDDLILENSYATSQFQPG